MVGIYLILGMAIAYFAILLWRRSSNWGYASFASIVIFLCLLILIDKGKLYRYKIEIGDKIYQVSPNMFENIFENNLDNIGQAVISIYEKYFIIETIDLSEESEKWKIKKIKGKFHLFFKLKYKPIEKTIQIISSEGMTTTSKEISYKSGNCIVSFDLPDEIETKEKILKKLKEYNVFIEIRYLRKIS